MDLPEAARRCPRCHRPYRELTWTEDSEEVDVQVQVRVLRYRRKRYEKRCICPGARFVTVPVAPKASLSALPIIPPRNLNRMSTLFPMPAASSL